MHGHNELSVTVAGLPLRLRRYDYLFGLGMLPLPAENGHYILYHIDDSGVGFKTKQFVPPVCYHTGCYLI